MIPPTPRRPGLLLAALVLAAAGGCSGAPRQAADARVAPTGVARPVRIVTDRYGIPHIEAESLTDLYFAWGWVTARDRLWQLQATRRAGRGAMWEWLGNGTLRDDGGAQLFRIGERADSMWAKERSDPEVAAALERYADGINAWIDGCRSGEQSWPPELARLKRNADPWHPADSYVVLLGQAMVLDLNLAELDEGEEVAERGMAETIDRRRFEAAWMYATIPASASGAASPKAPQRRTAGRVGEHSGALFARARDALGSRRASAEPDQRASNVFAVGPGRARRGMPIVANDPHLPLSIPGPFHVVHVSVPGVVDAIGAAVPGLPSIVSGRNRSCAWGVSSLAADVTDVYADTLSADGKSVRWNGAWEPLQVRPYAFRYTLPGGLKAPVPGQVRRYGPHGPIIALDRKRRVALSVRWAGDDRDVRLRHMLGLERSASAIELADRVRTLVYPGLNLIAGDRAGTVVYQAGGAVPDRGFAPEPGPIPGDGRHEWRGLVPAARMPRWETRGDAVVVNANNLPVAGSDAAAWPRYDWPHDRAQRIADRLSAGRALAAVDLAGVQNDVYARAAERFVPRLLAAVQDSLPTDPRERRVLEILSSWTYEAARGRVAPTLFRAWYGAFVRRSGLEGLPGLAAAALDGRAPEALLEPESKRREAPGTAARAALRLALRETEPHLGPDIEQWTYGRAHIARFEHRLAEVDRTFESPTVVADGENSTPCVGRSHLPWSTEYGHAAAFRMVTDLADPDSAIGVVVPGNSGDPRSGHARDHLERWADHLYVPLHLDPRRIEALTERVDRLEPRR